MFLPDKIRVPIRHPAVVNRFFNFRVVNFLNRNDLSVVAAELVARFEVTGRRSTFIVYEKRVFGSGADYLPVDVHVPNRGKRDSLSTRQ